MTAPAQIPWSTLVEFPVTNLPVISLYLDMRPDKNNKKTKHAYFFRNELHPRLRTYRPHTPEYESVERDIARIEQYVDEELPASADAVAIFACAGLDGFFETIPLDAPLQDNALFVYQRPHLYPLMRVNDQHPRYAAVLLSTDMARLHVFGLNETVGETSVESERFNRTQVGGYSQSRYQSRIDHWREQHVKDVAETLERVVRQENIAHVVIAGDDTVVAMLRGLLAPHVASKVVDSVRLDMTTPEHELLERTMEALRRHDARTDGEKVERVFEEYRGNGLATAGLEPVLEALARGQVMELLVSADFDRQFSGLTPVRAGLLPPIADGEDAPADPTTTREVDLPAELTARARHTGATVTFIEDVSLLSGVDGVGALLRFRV